MNTSPLMKLTKAKLVEMVLNNSDKEEIQALKQEIKKAKKINNNYENEIAECENEIAECENEIQHLNNSIEDYKVEVADAKGINKETIADLKVTIYAEVYDELFEEHYAQIEELNNSIEAYKVEVAELLEADARDLNKEEIMDDLNTILANNKQLKTISKTTVWTLINALTSDEEIRAILAPQFAPKVARARVNKQIDSKGLYTCRYTNLQWAKEHMVFANQEKQEKGVSRGYSKLGIKIWHHHQNAIKHIEKDLMAKLLAGKNISAETKELTLAKEGANNAKYLYKTYEDIAINWFSTLSTKDLNTKELNTKELNTKELNTKELTLKEGSIR